MRLSVASTGGATGSGSVGDAACFSAVYSLTGSTTQPSGGGVLCAELEAAQQMTKMVVESRKRDADKRGRFMENSPFAVSYAQQRAHFETLRRRSPHKTSPH